MKELKLNFEEQSLVKKIDTEVLAFLKEIYEGKNYSKLQAITNFLIDQEKDRFFGEKEYDPQALAIEHAYSRGRVGGVALFTRLIAAAPTELARREKERKNG